VLSYNYHPFFSNLLQDKTYRYTTTIHYNLRWGTKRSLLFISSEKLCIRKFRWFRIDTYCWNIVKLYL